mgnify:FL=1
MAGIIKAVGPCTLTLDNSPFRMLVKSVTGQQLSVSAARSIWNRFIVINGSKRVSPASLHRINDRSLRAAGLSRAKIASIRCIQQTFMSHTLTAAMLRRLPNDEVKSQLMKLRGVGPWTSDMFLMFALGRLDVLPIGDLGIANAIKEFYCQGQNATPSLMLTIGEQWSPFRTIASWYCWQGLDLLRAGNLCMRNLAN